jgi:hypothetical protein
MLQSTREFKIPHIYLNFLFQLLLLCCHVPQKSHIPQFLLILSSTFVQAYYIWQNCPFEHALLNKKKFSASFPSEVNLILLNLTAFLTVF